jgi:predicted phage terminase large subunit-like protein
MKDKHLFLLNVYRKRLGYPDLKRAVCDQAQAFRAKTILIEDRASGTQLIQDLVNDGMHSIQRYEPKMEKTMRAHSVTSTIENGFVHLPTHSIWLAEYLHEMAVFPNGRFDDQVDATSQALDWFKNELTGTVLGYLDLLKNLAPIPRASVKTTASMPEERPRDRCGCVMAQRIPGGLRCAQCGYQWMHPDAVPRIPHFDRNNFSRSRIELP